MGLLPLQRSRRGESTTGFASPDPAAFRVSHPPDGLILPAPFGLVSCRWRSWGFALRRLSLPGIGRPYSRPSTGVPLARMALKVLIPRGLARLPGVHPPGSPWPTDAGLPRRGLDPPLGFLPSKVPHPARWRPLPASSSRGLRPGPSTRGGRSVMPLGVSIASGPGSLRRVGRPS